MVRTPHETTISGPARRALRVTTVRLGGLRYAVLPVQDPGNVFRWTAFDAAGNQLGTGSDRSF